MKLSTKNEIIYCIGDSHVAFLSGNNRILPEWPKHHEDRLSIFKTYLVGPRLAFNISVKGSVGRKRIISILNKIPKKSLVMLVFGEIDCRVHLIKEAHKQKRNIKEIVKECVDRYFLLIKEMDKMGYYPIVWCVPPSTRFNLPDIELPTVGSSKARNNVSKIFNKYLAKLAAQKGYPVISIFNKLIDKKGNTNMEYFIDPIHLSSKALPFVLDKIKSNVKKIHANYSYTPLLSSTVEYLCLYFVRRSLYFLYIMFRNITHFPYPRRQKLVPY